VRKPSADKEVFMLVPAIALCWWLMSIPAVSAAQPTKVLRADASGWDSVASQAIAASTRRAQFDPNDPPGRAGGAAAVQDATERTADPVPPTANDATEETNARATPTVKDTTEENEANVPAAVKDSNEEAESTAKTERTVYRGLITQEIARAARSFLDLPMGAERAGDVEGRHFLFVLERHYHPPGFVGAPNGWHKGVTVYETH
jgi:hypothetical protein